MKIKRKYQIKGLPEDQRIWLQSYEDTTMLEPIGLEDLREDPKGFNEIARWNIRHFEDYASETLAAITSGVPWDIGGQ